MALRSNSTFLRSMVSRLTRKTTTFATSTPKMKPQAPAADYAHHPETEAVPVSGEFLPVYVAIGMILLSMGFGLSTAFHQLKRAPNVCVKKSRRETVPEVVKPEHVAEEGNKFLKESFFRKIAHAQDIDHTGVIPDPINKDIFSQHPRAITLKDVGVDPVKDSGGGTEPRPPRH